ncbi:hypothetical protein O0L34_g53 [Tuta absoluta]|nr:hypothetical protein O0L34_g53 [Tuta absoluta]
MHPNKVESNQNPKRQNPQRPTQANQRPTQTKQKPNQANQRPTQTNQKPSQVNQRPTEINQHRPTHMNQWPSQINPQQPITTNQQKPTLTSQHKPSQANQKRPNQSNQKPNQILQNSRPSHTPYQNPALNLNHSLISQLDALIKSYRDQQKQKQQKKTVKSQKISPNINQKPNHPIRTIEITKHTVQAFTIPQGDLQQWKNGKSVRYNKPKGKHKVKGKPRKRKKTNPFEEYNRLIRVGTW